MTETHQFQAEVSQVLRLVINSLYSNKDIFLRELVSNASDALDKLRFRAITEAELLGDNPDLRIRLVPDAEAGTLTISDNGVGMTREELIQNLGTIAHSGSRKFFEAIKDGQADVRLIGEFGVGFYSAYLVAEKVEVTSRAAGQEEAFRWTSDAKETFRIEPAQREGRGTDIVLHLNEDLMDYAQGWKLRNLVSRYSDFVGHPIEMRVVREVAPEGSEDDENAEKVEVVDFEVINQGSALWQRSPGEIEDEQYEEFFKHLTHDWEGPMARTHFHIEGTQLFTGLLFVPKRPPFDLFDRDQRHGVRLYVKRVFIMDDCEELLPRWLRFVRGIVDSDDLPLNVSREILQDSSLVRTIQKQVVKKTLDMLEELAKNNAEEYRDFWGKYGIVLKEGVHFEPRHKNRLAKLLRYESSTQEDVVSLDEYVERMPFAQKEIYYAIGASRKVVESSPHLEAVRQKGYEVLYMTDAIDQWVTEQLKEYDDKKLVSVMNADLNLDGEEGDEKNADKEAAVQAFKPLTERFQKILDEHIKDVRVSDRLTNSPVCLVVPEGGMPSHIEQMLRANRPDMPRTRRILEVNPKHPLIGNLNKLLGSQDDDSTQVKGWVELLYNQALLAEGSPIEDPAGFASRMTELMQAATAAEIGATPNADDQPTA